MVQEITPQHFGNVSHTHRGPRVAGFGFLYRVHAQGAQRVGALAANGFVVFISLYPCGLQHLLNLLFQFHLIDSKQSDPFR